MACVSGSDEAAGLIFASSVVSGCSLGWSIDDWWGSPSVCESPRAAAPSVSDVVAVSAEADEAAAVSESLRKLSTEIVLRCGGCLSSVGSRGASANLCIVNSTYSITDSSDVGHLPITVSMVPRKISWSAFISSRNSGYLLRIKDDQRQKAVTNSDVDLILSVDAQAFSVGKLLLFISIWKRTKDERCGLFVGRAGSWLCCEPCRWVKYEMSALGSVDAANSSRARSCHKLQLVLHLYPTLDVNGFLDLRS